MQKTFKEIEYHAIKLEMIAQESPWEFLKRENCLTCNGEGFVDETVKILSNDLMTSEIEETGRKVFCPSCKHEEYENHND